MSWELCPSLKTMRSDQNGDSTLYVMSSAVLCRHGCRFVFYHPKTSTGRYLRPIGVFQMQIESVTFIQGHFRSHNVTSFFACNFLQKRVRAMQMVWLRCQDASFDMHINLPGSLLDLHVMWPEVRFWLWHLGVKSTWFDASRRGKTMAFE